MNDKRPENRPASTSPPQLYPGYPPPYAYYPPEGEASLLDYWDVLVEHKVLITLITLASTAIALAVVFLMTPIYRAETFLAPVLQQKSSTLNALASQFGDLAALAGVNLDDTKNKSAEAVATLRSRSLAVAFINEEKLKPVLFPEKWDTEKNVWKDSGSIPTNWQAFELFDKDIRFVSVDRKTGFVTLTIEWKDPVLAAKWANSLVKRVNDKLRTRAIEEAETSINYLKKQLTVTSTVEVQQAIYRLIEAQTKSKMLAATRREYAFNIIDPAVPSEREARPKRVLVVTLTFITSLLGAFVLAFVWHHTRKDHDRKQRQA